MRLQRIAPTIALRCSAILPVWLPCKIFFTTEDFPTQAFPKVLLTKWRNNKPRPCEEERRSNPMIKIKCRGCDLQQHFNFSSGYALQVRRRANSQKLHRAFRFYPGSLSANEYASTTHSLIKNL